jgi:transcriptional regulator with XRE-family HTH domain
MSENQNNNLSYLFGARLKLLREALKTNQRNMAEMLGLPAYRLNRYEKGNNGSLPRIPTIQMLARFFRVPMDWLLSPQGNLNEPLPEEFLKNISNIKFNSYLALALRCSEINNEDIPEMVEEIERTIETLRKWKKKDDKER